ncbi:Transmembrane nucleoporin, variant 2 [Basidiobolus ranarum]
MFRSLTHHIRFNNVGSGRYSSILVYFISSSMSMKENSTKPVEAFVKPFSQRVRLLTMNVRFVWWLGHVVVTTSSIIYFLKRPFSYSDSKPWYYLAYVGTLVSYGMALWKAYGIPKFNTIFAQKIIDDENVQYFVMTVIWLLSSPVLITLIPFSIYSSFHVIDFIRTAILPVLAPSVNHHAAPGQSQTIFQQVSTAIKRFEDAYYERCMGSISYIEVLGVVLIILKETLT